MADQLADVREQISQREREAAQYRASMDLLRANGANGIDSPALQSLAEELGRSRAELNRLAEREQALSARLQQQSGASAGTSDEVSRLASLLQGYYAEAEAAAVREPVEPDTTASEVLAQTELDHRKVLLSGTEGIAAINLISERLARRSPDDYSRQRNIVFNVELRNAGQLVSKSNHSLRPVGESHFVGKVALRSGSALISIRDEEWRIRLDGAGEYLVTLYTPSPGEPQLHVIPVAALRATRWTQTPDWLPPLGDTASRS